MRTSQEENNSGVTVPRSGRPKKDTRSSTPQTSAQFMRSTVGIVASITNMKQEIEVLSRGIQEDQRGLTEFRDQLAVLNKRRDELISRISEKKKLIEGYEKDFGPFELKYKALVKEIDGLYGAAKGKHAKGLELLVRDFNYHESFRRWNDDFNATPFKPK